MKVREKGSLYFEGGERKKKDHVVILVNNCENDGRSQNTKGFRNKWTP
jgi:hypothetical protein